MSSDGYRAEVWSDYVASLDLGLRCIEVTDAAGAPLDVMTGFRQWHAIACELQQQGRALYFVGNGASATIANHMAADFCKTASLRAFALTQDALLTAIGNDIDYAEVFALPLRRYAREADLLVTISSSGASPNVIRALQAARELSMTVVTLSGMAPQNASRTYGHLNFYVPLMRYGWIEAAHQVALHYWLDEYVRSTTADRIAR